MKFKNIVFGFLKTWLLVALFYSNSLYAYNHMFIILQDYSHTADEFLPYTFEKDLSTGNLIKVFDTENNFQFKTYSLNSEADMSLFEIEVKPTLLKWAKAIKPLQYRSTLSSRFSKNMLENVGQDLKNSLSKEIHVATYKGNIEAISYADSAGVTKPNIGSLVANPEGLRVNQTVKPKGGGSSLLSHMLRKFKEGGAERVQLYSIDDKYYQERGWQIEPKSDFEPEFNFNFDSYFDSDSDSDSDVEYNSDSDSDSDFKLEGEGEGACGGS
ncbi:hypothetical protein THERMOT_2145 [Bathymodiolus thermophilus thioautotrophic gill symbiont]|uniref:hypothetical protein n=1 Tax=Bathymodiolus thermophilus thioautotrophic gill symbiont TaxID=2360 RepID=UPI00192C53E7|nr:hypothetical protein [Bathymodiolus thermophilus thioautotrophic gill symbiont]CAB5505387.1 hypothetical protein THERMOT_2145 [Bathymodiolus thermophilus thioautotrophic gill symbiont]